MESMQRNQLPDDLGSWLDLMEHPDRHICTMNTDPHILWLIEQQAIEAQFVEIE